MEMEYKIELVKDRTINMNLQPHVFYYNRLWKFLTCFLFHHKRQPNLFLASSRIQSDEKFSQGYQMCIKIKYFLSYCPSFLEFYY